MSIIIVEGVDGSGKTTLIRTLREYSSVYFWIASSSRRPQTILQLRDAIHWLGQCSYLKLPIICDRYPVISEEVYGPVMRDGSLLNQLGQRELGDVTEFLSFQVDRIIYCRPPIEVIKENLKKNKQMDGVIERLPKLLQRYDDLMNSLRDDNIFVQHFDYTNPKHQADSIEGLFFGRI